MAGHTEKRMQSKRLAGNFSGCYVFAFTLLEVLGKTHMSVHDNNHAFIQANSNDVRFMGIHDGLQVFMHKDVASSSVRISQVHEDLDSEDAFFTSAYLKFVPPRLDFKERHLGVPHLEKVTLVNTDDNKTIHMSSVSGNTLHFHSSFFQDKTIPPKGNTTFAVVFLGRTEGQVSTSLYIHTSEGTFKYHVSGASVCSPYRLRPLGGVRLPLNAAFQPLIQLHNPHHYPIQVVEVYSSGSEFHLELPGGEMEGPKALWEVPPYTTKPVIRAKFQANSQSNHTAYIRLKLNNSEEVLVVPVEVEVTSQPGLYSQQHSIDFGIGGSQDEPKRIMLYLCSSLKKTLKIQSVSASPASSALKINFEPTKIPPGTSPVEVAELVFDWKVAFETKQTSGKIFIKSKQNQYKLGIPFAAKVLEGGLRVNELATRFLTTESRLLPRHLTVENQFKVPIAVNNVSILESASGYFQIKNFKPTVIPPKKSVTLLTVDSRENGNLKDLKLESGLILFTNVSDVTVPLLIYNGKLTKIFPRGFEDLELLDVGLVGCGSTKTIRIGLQNNNPLAIEIKSVESNSQLISPQILGIYSENASEFLSQYDFANLTNSTNIKPNEIVVLEIVIKTSKREEILTGDVTVLSQYEKLTIPVKVSVAQGALEMIPNQIVLDDCFPGKICTQPLKIQSTFNRPMTAMSISSVPPDSRMSFTGAPGGSEILPSSSNYIGDLKWEPGKNCGNQCYLGTFQNSSGGGSQWMQSELLSPYVSDLDANLLRDRHHRLLNLTNGFGSGHWQDIVLRLDTNEVREELFRAKVRLIWPKFSNTSKIVFPLTQVTNTTLQRLKLFNSASHLIAIQLVTEWAYPQAKRLVDSFPPSLKSNLGGNCFDSSPKEFYISQESPNGFDARGKLNTTLAPGESYEVTIAYTPRTAQKSCSLLFVRNNLTVIEVIELHGRASHAQLKFGNRKPGSDNPLMFEIAEKHLKDCNNREKSKKLTNPNLTVKRSFIVRNVGDLPVFIHNFYINGLECEGYGYSVLNCASFELPVNGTKKIDVAFTPDFTLTKIQRTLTIDTSLGTDVNYTLVTTLPPFFLSACSSVLGRPPWEPLLYYSAVSFMVFLLFCVLAAAFFESDRILKCALMTLARDRSTVPLDLRQIGTSVAKEFGQNSTKKSDGNHWDQTEKGKGKEAVGGLASSWSPDERQKDEKREETHVRSEESPISGKERDGGALASVPGIVQLNNLTKNKKKLSKKNSNSSDTTTTAAIPLPIAAAVVSTAEQIHESGSNKKKEKNFSSSGWCGVFSRENGEKTKAKSNSLENESVKQIRNDLEVRREDRKSNKTKKVMNKEPINKEEEETSSITTDSSNDAEKENSEAAAAVAAAVATAARSEKSAKKSANKERKSSSSSSSNNNNNVLECRENNCEGDCDEEDGEREKKNVAAKNGAWKGNPKSNKFGNVSETAINVWKPNPFELAKNVDFFAKQKLNKIGNRERKEKAANKRRFGEKVMSAKAAEPSAGLHRSSPCWEHRSFSEVVARNDGPLLYSNVVSSTGSSHQRKQPVHPESVYSSEAGPKASDGTVSTLGPIGSKKPLSHWSPLSYNAAENQSNLFNCHNFADPPPGYLQPHSSPVDFPLESGTALEDSLPIDPKNLWEDQHAAMELMHQQDAGFQLSWKENWLDYLWCSNRNVHQPSENLGPHDAYVDSSWGSFLRSSWASPTPWSPSAAAPAAPPAGPPLDSDDLRRRFPGYEGPSESEGLMERDLQSATVNLAASLGQAPTVLNEVFFQSQSRAPAGHGPLPRARSRENLPAGGGLQFDPFHSLSSIWAPKTQNSWNSPGNQ